MFSIDFATGELSLNSEIYQAKIVNDGELMMYGYGSFFEYNGMMMVEDNPFLQDARELHLQAQVVLANGLAFLLKSKDLVRFNSSIDIGSEFPFGATPVGSFTLVLSNEKRRWDDTNFDEAMIRVDIGAVDADGEIQYLPAGKFTVDTVDIQSFNSIVTLSGIDDMGTKMMAEYTSQAPTLGDVALHACFIAGVPCNIDTLPGKDKTVKSVTFSKPVTCKDAVGWAAQQAGCVAYFDKRGILCFSNGNPYLSVYPSQYIRLTTSAPNFQYNYRLVATTHDGTQEFIGEYEPYPGHPFYQFSIVLSPFWSIGPTDMQDYITSVGSLYNGLTSGLLTWRGGVDISPFQGIGVVKSFGNVRYIQAAQNRVIFDGSLTYETGLDFNSLTKNRLEKRE